MDYYLLTIASITFAAGCVTGFLFFYRLTLEDVKTLKKLKKESPTQKSEEFQDLLLSNIDLSVYENTLNAIEYERQRIGNEAHDEFAAQLNSLDLNLQVVNRESHSLSLHAEALISEMRTTIKFSINSLRNIINEILPPILDSGNLDEALKELCVKNDRTKGTVILLRTSGEPLPLTSKQKLHLYRIVQELLNNCLKHSKAWNIFIKLDWKEQELKIIVKDNGIGLREDHVIRAGKHGMTSIFLRSAIIGAKCKFNSPLTGMEFELTMTIDNTPKNAITKESTHCEKRMQ